MSYFPLFFNTCVVCAHVYLFWNLRRAFGGGPWQYAAAAVIAALLFLTLFRGHALRLTGLPLVTDIAYVWAGFLILVTLFSAGRDGVYLASFITAQLTHRPPPAVLSGAWSFRIALLLGAAAFFYSLYEAQSPRIVRITLETSRLPAGTSRVRIAALSDLHLVRDMRLARLENAAALVGAEKPDIVVLLGDTVDDHIAGREELRSRLARIRAPGGQFAVIGNHELYRGLGQAVDFLEAAGFTLLRGSHADSSGIRLVGADDPAVRGRVPVVQAVDSAAGDAYTVLLTHRPETPAGALGKFDLQLSGHTHGGQIWPVRYPVRLLNGGHPQGLSVLNGEDAARGRTSRLYLSNGTGYWGPPVRFLTFPEITIIDLVPEPLPHG